MLCSRPEQSSLVVAHVCSAMRSSASSRWACSLGLSPSVLRLDCRIAHTISRPRLLLCGSSPIGARTVGSVLHQRSTAGLRRCRWVAVIFATDRWAVTVTPLSLCGCFCLLVARNIDLVSLHVCRAKCCVFRTDGHEPFSSRSGCLVRTRFAGFYFTKGFYLRSIAQMRAQSAWIRLQLHCVSGLCLV